MRSTSRHATPIALGLLCLAGWPRTASAQTQPAQTPPTEASLAEAREHFDRGVLLFDRGDNEGAHVEFQRAWELSGRPTVLFNIAATSQALRRYGEAITALRRFLAEATTAPPRQRRDAERSLRELEQLVAHVRVAVDPPDAALTLDGRAQAAGGELLVGPGTHRVEATRAGHEPASEEFTVASGESRELRLTLPASGAVPVVRRPAAAPTIEVVGAPPGASVTLDGRVVNAAAPITAAAGPHRVEVQAPGRRPWRGDVTVRDGAAHRLQVSLAATRSGPSTWFWAAAGASVALAVGSAVTGGLAIGANSEHGQLPADDPGRADLESRGRALAVTADVLGVAAIGAGVAAVVLYLRGEPSSATFALAPGGAAVRF